MTQIIKTKSLIDNPISYQIQKRSNMYILPKEEKEAEELFEKGKKIYATIPFEVVDGEKREKTFHRQLLRSIEEIHTAYSGGYVCGIKMPRNKLLDEEYNVLNILATRSGEECWFWLVERGGCDVVRDLEANSYTTMALSTALPIFVDGLLDLDHYRLTEEEKEVALRLFDRFGVEYKPA